MRPLALLIVTVGLMPMRVFAQEASESATPVAPPPAETLPAPVAEAPAPEAPPAAVPPPPPPPVLTPPSMLAPAPAPTYTPPPATFRYPSAAPAPQAFSPQPSPLITPPNYYSAPPARPPVYAQPAPPPVYAQPAQPPVYAQPAQPPVYAQPAQPPTYSYPYPPAYSYPYPPPYYQLPPPTWSPQPAQPETPNYVLPPLPPGYVYMPTPTPSAPVAAQAEPQNTGAEQLNHDRAYDELTRIDARMTTLQREPVRIGGPITLMVLGYGTTVVAGLTGLASFAAAESIQNKDYDPVSDRDELDFNNDGRINGRDTHLFRRSARIAGGVAGAGLLIGIIGTRRLNERRELRRNRAKELKGLAQRRAYLRSELGMSADVAPGHYGVTLQSQF